MYDKKSNERADLVSDVMYMIKESRTVGMASNVHTLYRSKMRVKIFQRLSILSLQSDNLLSKVQTGFFRHLPHLHHTQKQPIVKKEKNQNNC